MFAKTQAQIEHIHHCTVQRMMELRRITKNVFFRWNCQSKLKCSFEIAQSRPCRYFESLSPKRTSFKCLSPFDPRHLKFWILTSQVAACWMCEHGLWFDFKFHWALHTPFFSNFSCWDAASIGFTCSQSIKQHALHLDFLKSNKVCFRKLLKLSSRPSWTTWSAPRIKFRTLDVTRWKRVIHYLCLKHLQQIAVSHLGLTFSHVWNAPGLLPHSNTFGVL